MDSPWLGMLLKPGKTVQLVLKDQDAPILALLPVMAGALGMLAFVASMHKLLTIPASIGLTLLYGPPTTLLITWLASWCIRLSGTMLGGTCSRDAATGILAWSWLPLIYLSPVVAALLAFTDGTFGLLVFGTALFWQIVISGLSLHALESFSKLRSLAHTAIALVLLLLLLAGMGAVLSVFFDGVASVTNMLL